MKSNKQNNHNAMNKFEYYDYGEHSINWLHKHYKKDANRYERHKEKLRLHKLYKGWG